MLALTHQLNRRANYRHAYGRRVPRCSRTRTKYIYDSIGRPSTTTISADTTYQIDYAYNNIGALDALTYPTSTSSYRLKLQYDYQYGQPYRIKDFNAPTTIFWTANGFNGRNQITQETLGNGLVTNRAIDALTGWLKSIQTGAGGGTGVQNLGYEWDLVGNLKKRKDLNQSGLTEEFFYDNLYRLDKSELNGVENLNVDYDALGNITGKSDVGTYTYHATKKHQVASTSNGWSFSYDNTGNMTSGRGATIAWTDFNYPATIANGSNTSSFSYTPDRQYWRQISNYTSGGAATTIYVGGLLEKVTTVAGTDYRHMIRAGGASIIVSRQSTGTNSTHYVTRDHLGSSSAITNSAGAVLVNSSFDAFGKRRGSNWSGSPSGGDWTAIAATTRRGYTDHTMLDNVGLIHMNGRVQDPVLGRFASADPLIPQPAFTQSFNRYSYVNNNPLTYLDPSGFCPEGQHAVDRETRKPVEEEDEDGSRQDGSVTGTSRATDCVENEITVEGSNRRMPTYDIPKDDPRPLEFPERPQTEIPCLPGTQCDVPEVPPCLTSSPVDVKRAYKAARRTAFDRFNSSGKNKEEAYSIFRNDSDGELLSVFRTGGDGWSYRPVRPNGYSLQVGGHIHNRPTGISFWPLPPTFVLSGPSVDDMTVRNEIPRSVPLILQEKHEGKWRDVCIW